MALPPPLKELMKRVESLEQEVKALKEQKIEEPKKRGRPPKEKVNGF